MRLAALCALLLQAASAQLPPADVPNLNDTQCGADCIRCASDGCVKCAELLVWPQGTCTHHCPAGTKEAWAHDDHLMGRVCYPAHSYNEALIGGGCGIILCIALVTAVGAYLRCRSSGARAQPLPQRPDDDAKLREFHKQLDCLRPQAYTLLAILNHTRHQVRELYLLGNSEAAVAYSGVLSDLAKLLILLNKQHVPVVPDDWPRLACWADRTLKRYGRMKIDDPTRSQLVNFLPSPPSRTDSNSTQQSFTTFKPPSYSPTSYDSNADKESQSEWSDVRPPSYSQVERERETIVLTTSTPWERRPIVRRESVWLEDEMFEMTRRPQDELTTEL